MSKLREKGDMSSSRTGLVIRPIWQSNIRIIPAAALLIRLIRIFFILFFQDNLAHDLLVEKIDDESTHWEAKMVGFKYAHDLEK
jgi:hypothetical protein